MSLAALVNGADCGPLNPLQGLTKNLDSDRGVLQDHFGVNGAGPSRGVFRTTQAVPSSFGEDAARFFSASQSVSPTPPITQPTFDLPRFARHSLRHQPLPPKHSLLPFAPWPNAGFFKLTFPPLEQGQTSVESTTGPEFLAEATPLSPAEADLLARTAGSLIQSVDHERTPTIQELGVSQSHSPSSVLHTAERSTPAESEDANDAYFRQDNEDYVDYWKAHHAPVPPLVASTQDWQQLHHDWEMFEATTTGVRRVAEYQFQQGNPYLLGEQSHNHVMHGGSVQGHSFSEHFTDGGDRARDPSNARAWYELGVKQQENEREQQAIWALQRSLELDPIHLPSWLALASHTPTRATNWIRHNEAYRDIVTAHEAGDGAELGGTNEFQKLIACLIAMARRVSRPGTGGDGEDYSRAQDCFRTALAIRPEDWLLYNRVGATLANGGRADEALSYYHRALEINPAYIRARFNLGISYITLKRYEEAAQYILDALVLQDCDGIRDNRGVTSNTLWQSLKTCCLHMERSDLAVMCDEQNLEGPFG
ncbi:hypothetical protein BJV77DRAFT_1058106 [Russula vinacea]|nr:hypothetical protein BJV77DRAFT_1058106 [Russula vinacea]